MRERIKERLIGAVVLVALAVVFLPVLIGPGEPTSDRSIAVSVPPPPREFEASIPPLEAPRMAKLDEARARHEGSVASSSPRPGPRSRPVAAPLPASRSLETAGPDSDAAQTARASGAWVVQLASFSDAKNAKALRDRLRASGYTAFTEAYRAGQGSVTRVYVGPELDLRKARQSIRALERDTKLRGIVVPYPGS